MRESSPATEQEQPLDELPPDPPVPDDFPLPVVAAEVAPPPAPPVPPAPVVVAVAVVDVLDPDAFAGFEITQPAVPHLLVTHW